LQVISDRLTIKFFILKFVAISDTHGKHEKVLLPDGDVLIHAGDITKRGTIDEVNSFLAWFGVQKFAYKIFIAGNHDFFFEKESEENIRKIIPEGVTYLNNESISINGIKIWGSPITPWFFDWAFNCHRGEAIKRYWDLIPLDTDILITHGPVFEILDKTVRGQYVGCEDLLASVGHIKPKVHICGHIHEAYGTITKVETKFINASLLNEKYNYVHQPVVFEL
jgi:Icc-related predicted phosphoesterase